MARFAHTSNAPVHVVPRNTMGSYPTDALLARILRHAEAGDRVRVYRPGFRSYDVLLNDTLFLVLPSLGGRPVGTFNNVAAAVLAGDRYVEAVRCGEFDDEGDDYPRGAA